MFERCKVDDALAVLIRRYEIENVLYFSSFHTKSVKSVFEEAQRMRYLLFNLCKGKRLWVPYELLAREIISYRHKDLLKFRDLKFKDWEQLLRLLELPKEIIADRFIQIGEDLHPYLGFYEWIFDLYSIFKQA